MFTIVYLLICLLVSDFLLIFYDVLLWSVLCYPCCYKSIRYSGFMCVCVCVCVWHVFTTVCDVLPLMLRAGTMLNLPHKYFYKWLQKVIEFYICYITQLPQSDLPPTPTTGEMSARPSSNTHYRWDVRPSSVTHYRWDVYHIFLWHPLQVRCQIFLYHPLQVR